MDFLEDYQLRHDDDITSTCTIKLPFELKPDFAEDVLSFENSDVRLYFIRLSAPERNFVSKSSRFCVHTIPSGGDGPLSTGSKCIVSESAHSK